MAKAPPSFQLYPADFDMGTAHLPSECVGCYIRLLCHQWVSDGLPEEQSVLAGIARETPQRFAKIWPKIEDKFVKRDGKLFNERLESIRNVSKKRSDNGKKGGRGKASDLL